MADILPDAPLTALKGISAARAEAFAALGICTVGQLPSLYPRAYELRGRVIPLAQGELCQTTAHIVRISEEPRLQMYGKKSRVFCKISDDSAEAAICFFNMPYRKKQIRAGAQYRIYGRLSLLRGVPTFVNPSMEEYSPGQSLEAVVPVYPTRAPLSQGIIRGAMAKALAVVLTAQREQTDPIPLALRERYDLASRSFALYHMHFPADEAELAAARRRIVFEELFCYGLRMCLNRTRRTAMRGIIFENTDLAPFLGALPFSPTGAQRRALADFAKDFAAGAYPMFRLLNGDVGSGKTVCAAGAMFLAAQNGYQSVLMAPTELLARQHAATLQKLLAPLGEEPQLLVGSLKASEKRAVKERIACGLAKIVVGTHALLEEDVRFAGLALVITDEQQRFGVLQRQTLQEKAPDVHVLMMTATPIPRTMHQLLLGDMDSSVLDELPPGRKPVSTHLIPPQREEDMLAYLHRQALAGKQIFVVCPAVEESDADLMSASACAEMLREKMGEVGIVLVHGRMKSAEKEAAMRDFAQGKAHILVATTVIEVGVDVPAAVIMVIENAERFGLSQLHQLRGRVGRGTEKSYCFLVSAAQGQAAKERLGVLCREQDGFAIAAQDLRLRGPGDYVSAVRRGGIYPQSGALQFALADPAHDMELLQQALGAANALSEEDPTLVLPQHSALRALVFGESLQANT